MSEKSLRLGEHSAGQFTEFVEPHEATIKVAISSDIRQVGKVRLMRQIATFLQSQGYNNVTLTDEEHGCSIHPEEFMPAEPSVVEVQKKVHIDLALVKA